MNECSNPPVGQPAKAAARPPWSGWRGSGSILVVDDDDSIRSVVARTVTRLGFKVNQASDGRQAVAQFESDPGLHSLVLLDYKLPGMDGSEVLSRLRRARPDARVILMSGLSREEALEEFTDLGVSGFLQKPFTLEMLVAELRAALDS
ncbi:MAG TPA: response regulator [Opitutaceae bacterium]|nr:response regulator [Opitutaceae bacterium]